MGLPIAIADCRFEEAAGLANHRLEELGLSSVRPHGGATAAWFARAATRRCCASRRIRCRTPPPILKSEIFEFQIGEIIAISVDGKRRLRLSRSLRGRKNCGGRGRAQPGLFRRGAARRTDNLNYGAIRTTRNCLAAQESVRGLADACRAFTAPITGGNCSLYNQSPGGPIDPTPTVAMVGLIEKPEHVTTQWFKDEAMRSSCWANRWTERPVAGPWRQRLSTGHSRQKNRRAAALRFGTGAHAAHDADRPDSKRPGEKRA